MLSKCCNNPKIEVVQKWSDWPDTHTALVSCKSCGKTKYVSNKASLYQWAKLGVTTLAIVFVFILIGEVI